MNKKSILYKLFILVTAISGGCSSDETGKPVPAENETGDYVTGITFTRAGRFNAAPDDSEDTDTISVSDFSDGSLIYISQMGTTVNPDFSDGATSNLYIYQYEENEDATWTQEFNFVTTEESDPIYWSVVKGLGQVGNSFSLYGMYFPIDQQIRFNVESDQSDIDNFRKSDIMGAYHATSALYTRLRFRFFHLMTYLKVTLYVPVEQPNSDNTGYTGFGEDAVINAYLINAATDFNIDWRANRSSDSEAPLLHLPESPSYSNITMFEAEPDNKVTTITVSDYYEYVDDDNDDSNNIIEDEVRTYHLSVLFPAQTFSDNMICFSLRRPGDDGEGEGNYVNYYFAASQLMTGGSEFRFRQGTMQYLSLYVPRFANKTMVVGAKLLGWTDASTGMTVVDQDNEDNDVVNP